MPGSGLPWRHLPHSTGHCEVLRWLRCSRIVQAYDLAKVARAQCGRSRERRWGTVGTGSALVGAAAAAQVADAHDNSLTRLLTSTSKGSVGAGKAAWQLVTLDGLTAHERSAVAWLVADAIMASRCGNSPVYGSWRAAALAGAAVDTGQRPRLVAFLRDVFGTPDDPGNEDHLEGHVAEWLWYLLMRERTDPREIVLLEPPKFTVTSAGHDGFVIYAIEGVPLIFRLWELKKHVGASDLSSTVRTAYGQLRDEGDRYLAQLTSIHADKTGPVGELCAQLVDLWIDADARAGAGVGVTSATLPPPNRCFTTMGKQLPQFTDPGQLEGMLCAVENYRELAHHVRRLLWSAL
jgi:hypothetical protein